MAVAIKEKGYTNIKIYNGGIKEWVATGETIEVVDALPEHEIPFWESKRLKSTIEKVELERCRNDQGEPLLTLLDLRISRIPEGGDRPLVIDTACPTVAVMLDDLQKVQVRSQLSLNYPVIVVTETGNRDKYAGSYLARFGYSNVAGLRFGMRGWIKENFPTRFLEKGKE